MATCPYCGDEMLPGYMGKGKCINPDCPGPKPKPKKKEDSGKAGNIPEVRSVSNRSKLESFNI